eukprot:gene59512-79410_t
MYGVGYLSGRFKTARYVFICIALAIAGLIALGFYLGADKVPLIIAGVFVAGFIAIGIAAIVVGVRVHWQRGVLGFMVRLALVTGVIGFAFVQLRPGPDPDEIWLVMALVSFIALVFGFFPATGGGSGNGDDDDSDSGWSSTAAAPAAAPANVDVGAVFGPDPRWLQLGERTCRFLTFEPDERSIETHSDDGPFEMLALSTALANEQGRKTLHLTVGPFASSLYPPNKAVLGAFGP